MSTFSLRGICARLIACIDSGVESESIFVLIECEYGEHLHSILDALLLHLKAYHDRDTIDERFHGLSELVLLTLCTGVVASAADPTIHTFKCLSTDANRFGYMRLLKYQQRLSEHLEAMIDIMLCDRNLSDAFDPEAIIDRYVSMFDIDAPCCGGRTLEQVLRAYDLTFMRQVTELYELHKRIVALLAAVRRFKKRGSA